METKEVVHKNEQPMKVLLQKIKTGYSWEISVQGKNIAEILPELRSANAALKREYEEEVMASLAILLYPDWQPQKAACPPGWSSGLTVHPGYVLVTEQFAAWSSPTCSSNRAMESR